MGGNLTLCRRKVCRRSQTRAVCPSFMSCHPCGRRAEGGEPLACCCAARCSWRRAHGGRAQRTVRAGRAAVARGAASSLRCGVWGARAGARRVLRAVHEARPQGGKRPPQARGPCSNGRSQNDGRTRGGRWVRLGRESGREEALYWRCALLCVARDVSAPRARDNFGIFCAFHAC